jgi:ribosome maturation factor RimP
MDDRRLELESGPAKRVAEIIEPTLQSMGFRLVRVKFTGRSSADHGRAAGRHHHAR